MSEIKKGRPVAETDEPFTESIFLSSNYTVRPSFPDLLAVDVAMTLANKMSVEMIHATPEQPFLLSYFILHRDVDHQNHSESTH